MRAESAKERRQRRRAVVARAEQRAHTRLRTNAEQTRRGQAAARAHGASDVALYSRQPAARVNDLAVVELSARHRSPTIATATTNAPLAPTTTTLAFLPPTDSRCPPPSPRAFPVPRQRDVQPCAVRGRRRDAHAHGCSRPPAFRAPPSRPSLDVASVEG